MNALKALFAEQGQAVWLDYLSRGFVRGGDLKTLVERDGLRGVTSNPAIFEKAIGGSDEYDGEIGTALKAGDGAPVDLYEGLAIRDIQDAADVLRPVFDASGGTDGFVSLEVSPYLALRTDETLEEARRLWTAVDRPNLMVKVPGTDAGIPAIRDLTAEGINVNVTLLFAQDVYETVALAYLEGLETFAASGGDVSRVASVASFFVSRIDAAIDKLLDEKIAQGGPADLAELKGKVAIANAKLAYRRYQRLFAGPRWEALARQGARPQRLLWASTGTKNKAYPDTLYIDELIGPDTVNTMPPATMDAFRDHGTVAPTLTRDVAGAERVLERLSAAGISLGQVTGTLVEEGVQLFADAADKLLGAMAGKRAKLLGSKLDAQTESLGEALGAKVEAEAESWRAGGKIRRLWQGDASLWSGADEAKWLGWLGSVRHGLDRAADYAAFAREVEEAGFIDAVVLGMGGSSLGPEVVAETLGSRPGFPRLQILDSTDPDEVRALDERLDLARTLFIVASKSGSTLEPNVFRDYFLHRMRETVGAEKAGAHFVAVTDPGSKMEAAATADGFRRIFHGDPSIGGRYSVLSPFGLVPAAAAGHDIEAFLGAALAMMRSCGPDVPPAVNPGLRLGLALGVAAKGFGRDKLTLVTSAELSSFGAWVEQLIAESTGKTGLGIIPIDGEPLGPPEVYGTDRLFVQLRLDNTGAQDEALAALEAAGHPVVRITVARPEALPQEFFRWEMATAVAGAVLGINPFDQPDVEASKIKTRKLTDAFEASGHLPAERPVAEDDLVALYADEANANALRDLGASDDPASWVRAQIGRIKPGDYAAILAYVERKPVHAETLRKARIALRNGRKVATAVEFGPRFLHSTGQAYKGGPSSGVFLQITADPAKDLTVPGREASFGTIVAAQARGDLGVLAERGRRALRIHLKGGDVAAGLARVAAMVKAASAPSEPA